MKKWNEKHGHLHSRAWNTTVCARQAEKNIGPCTPIRQTGRTNLAQPNACVLTKTVTQPTTPPERNVPGRRTSHTKKPNCSFGHVANGRLGCAFACRTPQHRHIELRTTTIENGEVQNRNDRSSDMVQQENDRMPETESPHANAITKTMSSHLRPIDNATTPSDKGAPHVQWERCSGKHKLSVKQRRASHMATVATSTKPPSPNTINIHEGTDRRLNKKAKLVDT